MYIKEEEIDTMHELTAFVEGQIEAVEDATYWCDFLHRAKAIRDKMTKAHQNQRFSRLVNKELKRLKKKGNNLPKIGLGSDFEEKRKKMKETTLIKMKYDLDLTQKAVVVALKRRNEYYDVTRKRDDYY